MNVKPIAGPQHGYASSGGDVAECVLAVEGRVPEWVRGTLLRNGPGVFEYGDDVVRHWFDGQAQLHRFAIAGGGVTYASRLLQTRAMRAIHEEGRLSFSEFATDPCRSIFKRAMSVFAPQVTDNALVSIERLGQRHYAMTEAPMAVEFDPETLETLGYGPPAPGTMATAHPHHDPASGSLVNLASSYGPVSAYRVFTQSPDGSVRRLCSQRVTRPGYVHSFAMTPRYVAHTEFPFVVNPIDIPLSGRPFIENFRWRPEQGTRIIVWDRQTGRRVGIYETDAGFAFHHVGAWEDGDRLVMEYVDHSTPAVIDALYLDKLRAGERTVHSDRPPPRLRRVTVDLPNGRVGSELRAEHAIEMPRIDDRRHLGRYRAVYGIAAGPDSDYDTPDHIVKLDNETGDARTWEQAGCYPGEPIFLPAPGSCEEDDGVLLSVVLDAGHERSFLLVLDAADLTELARADAPALIPHGIHGTFTPAAP